jgi:hypothetical protein
MPVSGVRAGRGRGQGSTSGPSGGEFTSWSPQERKQPLFEKSGAKIFVCAGPWALSPTQPMTQHNKVFLLLFVHKE